MINKIPLWIPQSNVQDIWTSSKNRIKRHVKKHVQEIIANSSFTIDEPLLSIQIMHIIQIKSENI